MDELKLFVIYDRCCYHWYSAESINDAAKQFICDLIDQIGFGGEVIDTIQEMEVKEVSEERAKELKYHDGNSVRTMWEEFLGNHKNKNEKGLVACFGLLI